MASLVLGSLGSSLLGPLGGFLGSALGGFIDNALFGTPQEGPKLDDLRAVRGDPGTPIPLIYGADRVAGTVIASTELMETKHKSKATPFGGKGGGNVTITYTYHVDINYLLSEGPILGVGRIWADGNLVRGTRYEMEASTAAFPENIGGIPYPSYYRDHYVEPATLPWSIDRGDAPHSATDDGHYYKMNAARSAMIRITAAQANNLLETTKTVVYWRDTATGYYIPVSQSHAYTGEKPIEADGGEVRDGMADDLFGHIFDGEENKNKTLRETTIGGGLVPTNGSSNPKQTLIDLGAVAAGGSLNFTFTGRSTSNSAVSLADFYVYVQFYGEGDNILVDSTPVGGPIGAGIPAHAGVPHGHQVIEKEFELSAPIPQGARFAVVTLNAVVVMLIFAYPQLKGDFTGTVLYLEDNPNIRDWPDYWNLYDAINDWSPKAVLAFDGPDDVVVYRGRTDVQPTNAHMAAVLEEDVPAYKGRAHIVFDTLQLEDYNNRIPNFSFEVVQFDNVRVKNVLKDMMDRAELDSKYYDLEALPDAGKDQFVMGYSITDKVTFRAAMETMLDAFRIDVAEIGNTLTFREKSRAIDYTILYEDLGTIESGSNPTDPIRFTYRDKVDMPRRLVVRYKDPERNYQPNTAEYRRHQGPSVGDTAIELASVLRPDFAKGYARDRMQDTWFERSTAQGDVPHKYIYLAPTDIVLIDGSNVGKDSIVLKLSQVTRGENGLIEVEGHLREEELYPFDEGEDDDVATNDLVFGHGGTVDNTIPWTKLEMYDLPPLLETDTHKDYGVYVAMGGGRADRWDGATLNRSTNNQASFDPVTAGTREAVFGTVVGSKLGSGSAEFIDTETVLRVELLNPSKELVNVSSDDLFQGANACLIGGELVQFMEAEKQGDGTWELKTFLRGRRGTDIAEIMDGHGLFEDFVMVQQGEVFNYADDAAKRNVGLHYKGVSFGGSLAETSVYPFTNTGKRLVPLSPHHITAERADNDVIISWTRRDRVYQAMTDNADLKNSEETETYEIEIMNDVPDVVRTVRVDDATQYVYTAAEQVADGTGSLETLQVNIYQISAVVGRGNKGVAIV